MAEVPPSAASRNESTTQGPDLGPATYPGMPRWVKVSAIFALILAVLVVIVVVASGGGHGPVRHMPVHVPAGQIPAMVQEGHHA